MKYYSAKSSKAKRKESVAFGFICAMRGPPESPEIDDMEDVGICINWGKPPQSEPEQPQGDQSQQQLIMHSTLVDIVKPSAIVERSAGQDNGRTFEARLDNSDKLYRIQTGAWLNGSRKFVSLSTKLQAIVADVCLGPILYESR